MSPPPRRQHRLGRAIAATVSLASTGEAWADITDCPTAAAGYTVYLSRPSKGSTAFANDAEARAYLERLQFSLDQSRDGKWIASPATDVRFVTCANRIPEADGHEFSPEVLDIMHAQRVLLEIWGEVDAAPSAGGTRLYSAQLNYLLVPVKHEATASAAAPGGMQRLVYPESPSAKALDPVTLVGRPLDIDAFVAASLGFKLLLEHDRELAHKNLCRADVLLGGILHRNLPDRTRRDVTTLRQFVQGSAARAIVEAQADPAYERTGVLRLQDATRPCAGDT